ncbi:MAG TPA: hypothetical protein VJC21_01680 [Candidatus Nanoarchaeia archaeon]|nr:hypothetical protein [Candidatus Nanoarchaeia archaeon]
MADAQNQNCPGRKLLIAGGLGALLSVCTSPNINEHRDLTGDGITDIMAGETGCVSEIEGHYLFIGREDGTFERTVRHINHLVHYYQTADGDAYFFDGEFYRLSPRIE